MRAVLFRSRVRRVRFEPADGLQVLAFGRLDVYAVRGEYQLVCEVLEPKGLGALQLAFEQLKARLAAEGLFDAARKRALPTLPRRVGLVTSPDRARPSATSCGSSPGASPASRSSCAPCACRAMPRPARSPRRSGR